MHARLWRLYMKKTNDDWKNKLTPEEYKITREKGTEAPFSGELCNNKEEGMYTCKCCSATLFTSKEGFDSGSGWPSFYAATKDDNVAYENDSSSGMTRTEIICKKCDAHLGHVFDDGPQPTGKRFCVNSLSLKFDKS